MNLTALHILPHQLYKKVNTPFFKVLLLFCIAIGLPNKISSQEVEVIDKKGTIVSVSNNRVTVNAIAPTTPIEGDVWFDITDPANPSTFVWDGAAWQEITHKGTAGSVFFAGNDGSPTEDNDQLFWDDTNDRLGIGTTTPDESLHVSNNMRLDGSFEDKDGDAGTAGQILSSTATGTDWVNNTNPIRALGKVSAGGAAIRITPGVTVARLSRGYYRVTLPAGLVSDADYIIQVSQLGRGGAGNDDPGISYNNQTTTFFDVIVGDNDNGGTDRSRFDGEFMFTILDL